MNKSNEYNWASASEWRSHVIQSLDIGRDLIEDPDHTFFEAIKTLSDVYLSLHKQRSADRPKPRNEHELENLFWGLQRSSIVIDSIVGSACVVLMRWIEQARQIVIGDFILLETKFPFEPDSEAVKDKKKRINDHIMENYGFMAPGKQVRGVLAVWQMGNVFKHGGGYGEFKPGAKKMAKQLGFSSQLFQIPEHEDEQRLQQMALKEVSYTLAGDSLERMALQLGCGPEEGLMPLYDHVESWRKDIASKFNEEQEHLRILG